MNTLFIYRTLLLLPLIFLTAGCDNSPVEQGDSAVFSVRAVVGKVLNESIEESIFLVGNLRSKESIEIRSEIEAKVTYIGFEEGENVDIGQVLFRLDNTKLEAQVGEARARYELAKNEFERARGLVEKETISVQQYDEFRFEMQATEATLRLTDQRMRDAVINAPFDGTMAERMISLGQFVNVGELLSTLVQTNPLEVEFNVPERYLGQLNMGQEIKTTSVAYPNEDFIGKVVFISPRLDEQDRTVLMKASIDNTDGRLKPGMFARLALVFEVRENALVVPEQAISYQGDQAMIIVMDGNGQAEFRDVIVGIRISGRAEILSGLEEGEIIVIEGIQKLGPGTPIEISEKSSRYGVERPGA